MSTHKRKGQSTQPCHGCGSTLPHWSNAVCDVCSTAIRGYNSIMAERAAVGDMVEMLSKERSYALPSVGYFCSSAVRDAIQKRVLQLTQWLSVPSESNAHQGTKQIFRFSGHGASSAEHEWRTVVRIRPEHAEALGELHEAIGTAIHEAHKAGHESGRNLLNSLASGEITSDQFNNTAIRKEGAKP
jgi:ribosomal protein L34E